MTDFQPINTGPTPEGLAKSKRNTRIVFAVLAAIALFFIVAQFFGGQNEDKYDMNNEREAISQCEARVEKLLKSPSTAEFESNVTGNGTWTVIGTVDAQNAFGAMVRANFQCTVVMNSGEGTATTTIDSFDG